MALPDLVSDPASWEPIESASADEVAAVALERLRWSLRHAYGNVGAYRRAWADEDLHPEDIADFADLRLLPFTTKADLRVGQPYGRLAVPRERLARVHASSGTTGRATVVGYTKRDLEVWAGLVARSIRAAGGRAGMTVHIAYGYGLFTGGLGAHAGAERLGCNVVPVSGGLTERQVHLIGELAPEIIMVTPSYLLAIVDEMERLGIDPTATSLQVGILGAEPWTEDMRAEIEARLHMHAVDIYGLSEVMGPGVASECVESKDGLHLWEDHFYPEIVDPVTGEVLADGEHGELVLTSLTKEAMPLIRYRTGDLTRLLPGTARPGFRRIAKLAGRADDMMIIRGVNIFPTQIEEIVLRVEGLSPHFQCVLTRPDRLDALTVRVEARETGGGRKRMAKALGAAVQETLGIRVDVEILDPGAVERSLGKARRVLDER